ncbi:MAG: polyvinylalcohol dehydrogenase [Verrucomicrobiales bacterium]|nr:polyvinylalcohol dehydrogenase [Verrucomicrobiales bacterium]|tara:strand:- start:2037 stop:3269 length:1233 start_codon:yes stop_codon:yes gene_type:complete
MKLALCQTLALSLCLTTAVADDWPRWRGADHTDISNENGLLDSWPSNGPKRVWLNKDIGLGYSSYSIVDGKLYTMGLRGSTEYLIAVDANSGRELWATEVGRLYKNNWGNGPRSTPTVDGNDVFAMGGHGDLICADRNTGHKKWSRSMIKAGGKLQSWGYTESVLVDGNAVICTPGGKKGTMLALNRRDGSTLWQSSQWKDNAQYSSIVPTVMHGRKQYVQLTQKTLAGVNAKTGDVLWKSPWQGRVAVIPTPIIEGNEVYIASGYGVGCKKVSVSANGKVTDVWVNKVMKNHHGGVIRVGDHLYGYSDGPGWVCQDWKTGEEVWAEKRAVRKGAIAYADGKFILQDETRGEIVLIDASPKGFKERGRFRLTPQTTQRSPKGKIWTHIVVSNGKMYVRDQELLFCFDMKG